MKPHTKPMIQNTSTLLRHTFSLKGSCMAIALLVSVMFAPVLQAQPKYGISSVTTVVPPHPITLDGFVAEGGTKIALQILPTDITIAQYPVMLKLVISGNGITIESKSLFIHEPVYLNGNELTSFDGNDLQAFFNPDNLSFSGYSKTQYQRNGRLPEGVYTVGFELYDVLRKIQVASVKSTLVFLFLNEVPSLNLPLNTDIISAAGTPVVNFRWSTRHSPLSATFFTPQYLFEMWDIQPEGMNPYEIVRGTRPVYATTVSSTYLSYGIAEPPLLPGHTYAWRVRESDPDGKTLFKNNGYSEVYTFKYGINCPPPELKADKAGTSNLSVLWQANAGQNKFELRYRDKKKKNPEWYSQEVNTFSSKVENLKSNTVYEIEVCAICGDQRSEYSNRVEMNTRQNTSFKCGQIDSSKLPQNKNPLRKLSSGDVFKAFGFDVQVKEASGSAGTYTGKGYVLVPLFNFIKIEAKFDNARINEEYQLIGGEVKTVYNLKNSLTYIPGQGIAGLSDLTDLAKLIAGDKEKNKFDDLADKKIEVDSVKEIRIEGNKIIVTDANGKTEEVPTGKVVSVKTEDGKEYVVDSNGTIYSSGNSGQKAASGAPSGAVSTAAQAGKGASPKYNVTFSPHNLQAYGFDYPTDKSPKDNYEQVSITENPIQVPWKSLEAGRIERTIADITGGPADSVRYYRQSNNVVMTAPGEKTTQKQVMLNGNGKNDEDKLFAWYAAYNQADSGKTYSRVLAGQLNLISYEKKAIKVVLVPVNNASCPNADYVKEELNKIYKSAVVEWEVAQGNNIKVTLPATVFDNTDPDDRMDYTDDMKAAISVLKEDAQYNRETYYLFFLDNAKDQTIKGYMPLKQQFGFIFKYKQYPDEYLRTIAHELGHGPFRLWHTFSKSNKYIQPQGSTDNLMDYASASALKLNKYQWDWMHNPEWRIYAFTGEEEGEEEGKETEGAKEMYAVVVYEGTMNNEEFKNLNLTIDNINTFPDKNFYLTKCYTNEQVEKIITEMEGDGRIIKTESSLDYDLKSQQIPTEKIFCFGKKKEFSFFAVSINKKNEIEFNKKVKISNKTSNDGATFTFEYWYQPDKLGIGIPFYYDVKIIQSMPIIRYKSKKDDKGKYTINTYWKDLFEVYPIPAIKNKGLNLRLDFYELEDKELENFNPMSVSIPKESDPAKITIKKLIRKVEGKEEEIMYEDEKGETNQIKIKDWFTLPLNLEGKITELTVVPYFGKSFTYKIKVITEDYVDKDVFAIESEGSVPINKENVMFYTDETIGKFWDENQKAIFSSIYGRKGIDLMREKKPENWPILETNSFVKNLIMLGDKKELNNIYYQTHGSNKGIDDYIKSKNTIITIGALAIQNYMDSNYHCDDLMDYVCYREVDALFEMLKRVKPEGNFILGGCWLAIEKDNEQLIMKLYKMLPGDHKINIYADIDMTQQYGLFVKSGKNITYEYVFDFPMPDGTEFNKGWMVVGPSTGGTLQKVSEIGNNTGRIILRSKGEPPVDFEKKK